MKKFRKNACRESREFCPPEGFAAWCRIEELSGTRYSTVRNPLTDGGRRRGTLR